MKTLTLHHHGILTQKFWMLNKQVTQIWTGKEQISTLKVSTDTRCLDSKYCLVVRQLAIHGRQLGLELLNLTVQATDGGKHSVFLLPIVEEQVVASEIGDISFQMSNFSLQISSLMLEPHTLKQRLLVLVKVLTSTEPPVINYWQSAPWKISNHEKIPQSYQRKNITQNSYRRYPTAKGTDSKLKKAKGKRITPLHHFNRTVPATTEPERKKNPYSPAVHTTKVPK